MCKGGGKFGEAKLHGKWGNEQVEGNKKRKKLEPRRLGPNKKVSKLPGKGCAEGLNLICFFQKRVCFYPRNKILGRLSPLQKFLAGKKTALGERKVGAGAGFQNCEPGTEGVKVRQNTKEKRFRLKKC